jgi:hypothetical protein
MPSLGTADNGHQLFCHSTLQSEMTEEFKNAKWVVLTSPMVA